jgi:Tol biopolymer transport system component
VKRPIVLVLALIAGACGGSSGTASTATSATTTLPPTTGATTTTTVAETTSTSALPSTTLALPSASELLLGRTTPAGHDEIFLAGWDGTIGTNLTDDPANDHAGEISADRSTMVFTSDRDGGLDVYLMDLTTRMVTRLTDDPADDWDVVWAPDGTHIAFFRASSSVTPTIYVMTSAGFDEVAITDGTTPANHVDWSPDGDWLLVWLVDGGYRDIYRMRPDGTDVQRITDTPGDEGPGAYSPDGSQIVFSYKPPGGNRDVWVMNADGSDRRQLTDDADEDWMVQPFWSPDGSLVLYQHGVRGEYWVVPVGGGAARLLFGGPSG